jgi:hypothetical protein
MSCRGRRPNLTENLSRAIFALCGKSRLCVIAIFSEGALSPDGSIRRLTMLVIASECFSGGKIRGIRVSRRKCNNNSFPISALPCYPYRR